MFNWIKKQVKKETPEQSEERRKGLIELWESCLQDDIENGFSSNAKIMEVGLHMLKETKKDPQEVEIWLNETLKWKRRF